MDRKKRGFTLAETVIVIAVIGILAALCIPVFYIVVSKSVYAGAQSDAYNTALDYECSVPDADKALFFVYKNDRYFVFEYSDGELIPAGNNGREGYAVTLDELMDRYNYYEDNYAMQLASYRAGDVSYEEAFGECFFHIASQNTHLVLLSEPQPEASDACITDLLQNPLGNVEAYKGVLIGEDVTEPELVQDDMPTIVLNMTSRYMISYFSGDKCFTKTLHKGNDGDVVRLIIPTVSSGLSSINRQSISPPEGFPDYVFAGWSESPDATEGFDEIVLGRIHNITLYAVWRPQS